jgi:hypothetical protein|nr:MAG TPA_asm: hypothetical protein [Caudoviricetes sp.]
MEYKHYDDLIIAVCQNRAIPVYKRHDNLPEYLEGGLMEVVQPTAKDLEYLPSKKPEFIKHHLNNAVYVKATAKGEEVVKTEFYKIYHLLKKD